MATLAMINGILIRMKPEKKGKHHRAVTGAVQWGARHTNF